MKTPKVSVVMLCYNHEKYIEQAIEGILGQTFSDFELIILDDASTDSSTERIEQYIKDPRVIFHKNERNQGISINCNIGFKKARGQYIAIQGGDDISLPTRLEKQVAYLDNDKNTGAVFSHVHIINDAGENTPYSDGLMGLFNQENISREDYLVYFFLYSNFLNASSEMIRHSVLKKIGLYKVSQFQLQDYDMHIRTVIETGIHIIEEPLLLYRVRDDNKNISLSSGSTIRRMFFETDSILDNYLTIKNPNFLIEIFGSKITQFGNITQKTIPYFLARLAMEHVELQRKLWGYKTLYAFLNTTEGAMDMLYRDCGFTYKDFIALEENMAEVLRY